MAAWFIKEGAVLEGIVAGCIQLVFFAAVLITDHLEYNILTQSVIGFLQRLQKHSTVSAVM